MINFPKILNILNYCKHVLNDMNSSLSLVVVLSKMREIWRHLFADQEQQ